MHILVDCPTCSAQINAPATTASRTYRCPKCGGSIRVPGLVQSEAGKKFLSIRFAVIGAGVTAALFLAICVLLFVFATNRDHVSTAPAAEVSQEIAEAEPARPVEADHPADQQPVEPIQPKPKPVEAQAAAVPPVRKLERFDKNVRTISFANESVDDSDLNGLSEFSSLENLNLSGTHITDAGLKEVNGIKTLRSLYVARTEIRDAGLHELSGLKNLEKLDISRTWITDSGLRQLSGLTSLRFLNLSGTSVSASALNRLDLGLRMRLLGLSNTTIAPATIVALSRARPELSIVDGKGWNWLCREDRIHDIIKADDLLNHYMANEVRADAIFRGRAIEVVGYVQHVGKDILDIPYVTLRSEDKFGIFCVQCVFDNSREADLVDLTVGQIVMIGGKCSGKFGNVVVRDCSLDVRVIGDPDGTVWKTGVPQIWQEQPRDRNDALIRGDIEAKAQARERRLREESARKLQAYLRYAKKLIADGNVKEAKERLNEIVRDYPGTPSADEAGRLLKGLDERERPKEREKQNDAEIAGQNTPEVEERAAVQLKLAKKIGADADHADIAVYAASSSEKDAARAEAKRLKDSYRGWLQRIVKEFGDTKAGREAKQLLKGLPGD